MIRYLKEKIKCEKHLSIFFTREKFDPKTLKNKVGRNLKFLKNEKAFLWCVISCNNTIGCSFRFL